MSGETSNRLIFWDILKGIAILLVVVGHQIQYTCNNDAYIDNALFKFIYGMHMSLFMLISGYFFYFSIQRHSIKDIILTRCRQCLIPIATVTIATQFLRFDFVLCHFFDRLTGTGLWFL